MATINSVSASLIWYTMYHVLSSIVYCQWIESNQNIRADHNMAVGVWNNTINILFGETYPQQKTTYSKTDGIVFDSETALNHTVLGYGQFYTQINNILYLINGHGGSEQNLIDTISTYNIHNNQFILNAYVIKQQVSTTACIASTTDLLFVVGGKYYGTFETCGTGCIRNLVQILNLNTNTWTQTYMQEPREALSCVVHPIVNALYAVAGNDGSSDVPTIERKILDDNSSTWQYTTGVLMTSMANTRCVVYDKYIYIIGGYSGGILSSNTYSDTVYIIDVKTNTVSAGDKLAYKVQGAAVIVVGNIIYAFGGNNNKFKITTGLSTFMYHVLPTPTPTLDPTLVPTKYPTTEPTLFPTLYPTTEPTLFPTSYPTTEPTLIPTSYPTKAPSFENHNTTVSPSVPITTKDIHNTTNIYTTSVAFDPSFQPTLKPTNISDQSNMKTVIIIMVTFLAVLIIIVAIIVYLIIKCSRIKKENNRPAGIDMDNLLSEHKIISIEEKAQNEKNKKQCITQLNQVMDSYPSKQHDEKYINQIHVKQVVNTFHKLLSCGEVKQKSITCNASKCLIYRRHFRDRFNIQHDDLKLYPFENAALCAKKQILDTVHCYIHHNIITKIKNDVDSDAKMQSNTDSDSKISQYVECRMNRRFSVETFISGWQFKYDGKQKNEIQSDYDEYIYIQPYYKNLKDELTQNDITCMTQPQFDAEFRKAKIHYRSTHCQKLMKII
eukprot:369549_1